MQESSRGDSDDRWRGSNGRRNERKLLDPAQEALRASGLPDETATIYVCWMREFILFHDRRHSQELGLPEINAFLGAETFSGLGGPAMRVEAERTLEFLYQDVFHRRWPRREHSRRHRRRGTSKLKDRHYPICALRREHPDDQNFSALVPKRSGIEATSPLTRALPARGINGPCSPPTTSKPQPL